MGKETSLSKEKEGAGKWVMKVGPLLFMLSLPIKANVANCKASQVAKPDFGFLADISSPW